MRACSVRFVCGFSPPACSPAFAIASLCPAVLAGWLARTLKKPKTAWTTDVRLRYELFEVDMALHDAKTPADYIAAAESISSLVRS